MCLSTVMRLMIEEMHQDIFENLRLGHSRGGPIAVQTSQRWFIVFFDYRYEPLILCNTCTGQFHAVIIQDGIQTVWVIAFTCQPFQPEAVREQQMIKRTVKAAEEDADVKTVR